METQNLTPRSSWFKSTFLAANILIGLTQQNQASITITVSESGSDLIYHYTGSIDVGATGTTPTFSFTFDDINASGSNVTSLDFNSYYQSAAIGTYSGNDPFLVGFHNSPSNGSGSGFSYNNSTLSWDTSFGATPGIISPTRSFTQLNESLASAFGTNLDSGPVLLWTHNTNGGQIFIAAVPEPSSALLLLLATLTATFHRRRC